MKKAFVFLIPVLFCVFSACGIPEEDYQSAIQEATAWQEKYDSASKENTSLQNNNSELQNELNEYESKNIGLQNELNEYKDNNSKLKSEIDDCKKNNSKLELEINNYKTEIDDLKDEIELLQFDIDLYKIVLGYDIYDKDKKPAQNDKTPGKTESEFSFVKVEVVNKYNLPENYDVHRYSSRVECDIKVTNSGTKSIRGIQGVLDIQDMFGKSIKSFSCDLTQQIIGPNQYHIYKGLGWDVNEFRNEDVKIYNSEYSTLLFVYTIKQILYSE